MDKKDYLIELRRKNEIVSICEFWKEKGIIITPDDFLEVTETLVLQGKILSKLELLDKEESCIVYGTPDRSNVSCFTKILLGNVDKKKHYIFFVKQATKLGGVTLRGNEILDNYEFILSESEYFHDGCSIFFCTTDAEKGVCFWKGEYDCRAYVW